MAGKYKWIVMHDQSIEGAIANFFSDIAELGEECREVVDNAEGGLAETQRIQTLGEAADALENVQEVDFPQNVPDEVHALKFDVGVSVPRSKRQYASRATRRDNAVSYANAAIDALRSWCDEQEEKLEEGKASDKENAAEVAELSEGAVRLTTEMREERESVLQELRDYADEVEQCVGEVEGLEFPGYGRSA